MFGPHIVWPNVKNILLSYYLLIDQCQVLTSQVRIYTGTKLVNYSTVNTCIARNTSFLLSKFCAHRKKWQWEEGINKKNFFSEKILWVQCPLTKQRLCYSVDAVDPERLWVCWKVCCWDCIQMDGGQKRLLGRWQQALLWEARSNNERYRREGLWRDRAWPG